MNDRILQLLTAFILSGDAATLAEIETLMRSKSADPEYLDFIAALRDSATKLQQTFHRTLIDTATALAAIDAVCTATAMNN